MACNCRFVVCIIAVCLASAFQHGYQAGVMNIPSLFCEIFLEFDTSSQLIRVDKGENSMSEKVDNIPYELGNNLLFLQTLVHEFLKKEHILWPVAMAMFPLGALLGSLTTVLWLDVWRCDRLDTIVYALVLTGSGIMSVSFCSRAGSKVMLIVGRLVTGMGVGLCDGVAPIYLAEISPVSIRGTVLTTYQLFITLAMMQAQGCGFNESSIRDRNHTHYYWPLFTVSWSAMVIFALYCTLCRCGESPIHVLLTRQDEIKTKATLSWLRNTEDVDDELEDIKREIDSLPKSRVALTDLVTTPSFQCCLIVVVGEQLCGVNILTYYSSEILISLGYDELYYPMIMTLCMSIGTIPAMVLADKVKIRTLLIVSLTGMFVFTLIMFIDQTLTINGIIESFCLIPMCLFSFFYAVGVGPVRWRIIVEMFDYSTRPLVVSLIQPLNFFVELILAVTFAALKLKNSYELFSAFAIFDLAVLVYVWFRMPNITT